MYKRQVCVCVCVCVQVLDLMSVLVAYATLALYVIRTQSVNEVMALWRHDPKVGELFFLYVEHLHQYFYYTYVRPLVALLLCMWYNECVWN